MENEALHISERLFEISVPVLLSLKEQFNPPVKRGRRHPEAKELSFIQLRTLFSILFGRDQVGKLARNFHVAQSAMSKMVDHLVGLGYVRKEPDPDDGRLSRLLITPKGRALIGRMRRRAAQKYVAAIERLPASDRRKMAEGVAIVFQVIEQSKSQLP